MKDLAVQEISHTEYTSRYIDITKCHIIKLAETCPRCGWELCFNYRLDPWKKAIAERSICTKCHHTTPELLHQLH